MKDRSQFVITNHSPILMAYPDAVIYQCTDIGIRQVTYEETKHFQVGRRARLFSVQRNANWPVLVPFRDHRLVDQLSEKFQLQACHKILANRSTAVLSMQSVTTPDHNSRKINAGPHATLMF